MDKNFLLMKLNRVVWVAFLEQEKIEEAIRYFEIYIANFESLKDHPSFKKQADEEISFSTGLFLNKISQLAEKYFNEKNSANSAICYAAYFKYNQEDVLNIKNFIETLDKLKLFDLQIDLLLYLENLNIKDPQLYRAIAEIYAKNNNHEKSTKFINKYMELCPEKLTAQDYNLKGCFYNCLFSDKTHNIEDAKISLEAFEKASDLSPYTKLYAKNGTIMAGKSGNNIAGKKLWERVLETNNLSNDDKYDYAAFCLKNGDFEGWHKYFESRFNKENNATQFPKIHKPKWDGIKDLSNSTLLVHFEQGFGDTFLMYGYLPRLVKLAKHVIFVVQDTVADLLKDNEYGIEIIPSAMAKDLKKIKFDYYIPSMSIPVVMKMTRENISVGKGFIKANKTLAEEYKVKYFNNDKFKIGLSFCGNATGDKTRDLSIDSLLPLDKLHNIKLYSLQKGITDENLNALKIIK